MDTKTVKWLKWFMIGWTAFCMFCTCSVLILLSVINYERFIDIGSTVMIYSSIVWLMMITLIGGSYGIYLVVSKDLTNESV